MELHQFNFPTIPFKIIPIHFVDIFSLENVANKDANKTKTFRSITGDASKFRTLYCTCKILTGRTWLASTASVRRKYSFSTVWQVPTTVRIVERARRGPNPFVARPGDFDMDFFGLMGAFLTPMPGESPMVALNRASRFRNFSKSSADFGGSTPKPINLPRGLRPMEMGKKIA